MVDLQWKSNPSIPSGSENAVEIPENEGAIAPDINDHVAAGYGRKVYIGKVLEIGDSDAKISFDEHAGTLSIGSIFREPEKRDEIWINFVDILHVVPVLAETKPGRKFEKFVLKKEMEKLSVWKNKNWLFFLFLTVLDTQCHFFFIWKTITSFEIETYIMQ